MSQRITPDSALPFADVNDSLWHANLSGAPPLPRPDRLPTACDVAIVGGGLTGLWTAYYLSQRQPSLSIAVFEANEVAFGASGRAGGWAIATLDGQDRYLQGIPPEEQAAVVSVVTRTLDDIEETIALESINCGYHRGGMVRIAARHASQNKVLAKYRSQIRAENGGRPIGEDLDAEQARTLSPMTGAMGAVTYPHCAVVDPARLAHGLAHAACRRGVEIHEHTAIKRIEAGRAVTTAGTVAARIIVPAVEGYCATLPSMRGRLLPVSSHVIATEPLIPSLRASIGLADRQAFADCSRISTYGQITEDDRIVLGALASYRFGAKTGGLSPRHLARRRAMIHRTLVALWPQLGHTRITHSWSGVLGVPRSFRPSIVEDRARGVIWGGGYVARGVANSALFGRTIAELICGHETPRTRAPWVVRNGAINTSLLLWEPEPLKWLGIAAATLPGRLAETAIQAPWMPSAGKTAALWLADRAEGMR